MNENTGEAWAEFIGDKESPYLLENWYPRIKDHTFATTIIPLSLQQALAIKKYKELSLAVLKNNEAVKFGRVTGRYSQKDFDEASSEIQEKLGAENTALLSEVEKSLDEVIAPFLANGNAAFVKLNTRSPKDAAYYSDKVKQILKREIKKSTFKGGTPEADIEDVILYSRASVQCLAVRSGAEAVQLLIRSTRVFRDISYAELCHESEKNNFYLALVVREWAAHILPEWEFRVFIFHDKITAATQYNNILYVPGMFEKTEEIKGLIYKYWDSVKSKMGCATYTMDLAITPDLDLSKVIIVELNNPPPVAGVGLFNWEDQNDRNTVLNGKAGDDPREFELRIRSQPYENVKNELYQPLRIYMDELRGIVMNRDDTDHTNFSCDKCGRRPISERYFYCDCQHYDVCDTCFNKLPRDFEHEPGHHLNERPSKTEAEPTDRPRCELM